MPEGMKQDLFERALSEALILLGPGNWIVVISLGIEVVQCQGFKIASFRVSDWMWRTPRSIAL